MNDFIIRDLRTNFKNNILQLFVIAAATALAMGILILHGTMSNRIAVLSEETGEESTVIATSEELFGEDMIEQVKGIDGVAQVGQMLEYSTEGEIHKEIKGFWLLGVTPGFGDMDKIEILKGRFVEFSSGHYEMLVDHKVANKENISVGDEMKVSLNGAYVTFEVVGIYKRNRLSMQPCYEFYVDGQMLQEQLKQEGKFNKINVVTSKQNFQAISHVTEEIKALLGEKVICETVMDRKANASRDLSSFSMLLWSVLAIFILGSVYLIYSTFCLRMDERIKMIAVLKTLGAKEKQIQDIFLREGLLVGIAGGIFGEIIGVFVGLSLCYFYAEKDYSDVGKYFTIKFVYVIGCMLVGMVVCYLGSIQPIRRVSKISPIAAMKNISSQQYKKLNIKQQLIRFVMGFVMLVTVLILSGQVMHVEHEGMVYTIMIILGLGSVLAMVLMVPYVITFICKVIFRVTKGKDNVELYLAVQNLFHNRNNTTVMASIAIAGIMIIASLHGMFSSARESVGDYVSDAFSHDYLIDCEIKKHQGFDEYLEAIKKTGVLKDYTYIDVYNYEDELSGKTYRIFGVEPEEYDHYSSLKLYSEQKGIRFKDLASNEDLCFVSRQIMIENHYHLGDVIEYECNGKRLALVIAAYFNSFTNDGRLIYMSAGHLKQIKKAPESGLMCVNKADGVSADEFEDKIRTVLPSDESSLLEVSMFGNTWKHDVVKGTGIFYVIFVLISIFVIFSLINNYITSILQRKSEVGILSSLGARSKGIKKMLIDEMLILYFVTLSLGFAGSYVTLYIFVQCLSAVFHADLGVYYPIGIMAVSGIILMVAFILLDHIMIRRILETNEVQLIKDRSI